MRVTADPDTMTCRPPGGGLTLLGGSPWRVLRLRDPAPALWDALHGGATLAEAAAAVGIDEPGAVAVVRHLLDAGVVHPDLRAGQAPDLPLRPAVHVVVPVHDRRDGLARLLDSLDSVAALDPLAALAALAACDGPGSLPASVTVVDDGSSDGSGELAAARGARVVRHERPQGPAAARHAGVAGLPDDAVVAFLDSDTVVTPGWLDALMRHLADPNVAAVAPRIGPLEEGGSTVSRYESVRSSLDLGPRPGPVVPRGRIAYVPAAAMLVRLRAYRSVGGFEPDMHLGEDVDFVWRLRAAGWTVRYEPAAVVRHDHRAGLAAFARRRFQYASSAPALDARHPGHVPPVAVSPWSAAAWSAAVTAPPWGALAGLGVAAASGARLASRLAPDGLTAADAARLVARGHLGAGRLLAQAVWRTHLPVVAAAAVAPTPLRGPARRALLLAAVVPNLLEWRARRPPLDPVRYTALRLVEDGASSAGLWTAAWRARRFGALVPDLTAGRVTRPTS